MKNIAILAERVTERALAAILPPKGVASVTINADGCARPETGARTKVHAFRNPTRFSPSVRITLVVADDAVDTVLDSLSFAYGAGLFSDAEAWISEPATAQAA